MAPLCARLLCALGTVAAQDLFLAQHQPQTLRQRLSANSNRTNLKVSSGSSGVWWKTIGPSGAEGHLCLDLPGGEAYNGNLIWLWECDGQDSAIWVFDNYQIRYGRDENYCVDAGGFTNGQQLMLWECNGYPQQTWGWDTGASRIFLNGKSTCFDWFEDDNALGQQAHVWDCNGLGNQYWSLWDSPPPNGDSGGRQVFPENHCQFKVGNFPTFNSKQELQADQHWSAYFTKVYGDVPDWGYPICPGAFQFLWQHAAKDAGVATSFTDCAPGSSVHMGKELPDGTPYVHNSFLEAKDAYGFIYNSKMYGQHAPDNHWVEVTHTTFPGDVGVIWYYMSVGSGIWIHSGKTVAFKDHKDAMKEMLNQDCQDESQDKWGPPATECEKNFDGLYDVARTQDVDTIQFYEHFDCVCGPSGQSSYKYYRHCMTEIIALNDPNGAAGGCSSLLAGGWGAVAACECDAGFTSSTKGGDCANNQCEFANCGIK